MMINKRLIGAVPESKKYIAGNVALQWCSLCANIAMMSAVTALLAALFAGEATQSKIVTTAVIALAAVAVRYGCTVGASRMGYLSSKAVKKTLRGAIYDKLLCLGASYSEQVKTSEVVQVAVEGVDQLETYFGAYLPQFFYAMLAPLTLFVVLCFVSVPAAVVLLVCVPLIPVAIAAVQTWAKKLLSKYWGQYTALGDTFLENLQGLTTLKIYQADAFKNDEMNVEAEKFRKITMKVLTMQLNSITIMDLIAYGGAALGVIMAATQLRAGKIDLAGALLIVLLAADFFIPMRQLGSFFHIAMNGMAASDKIFRLLDLPEPAHGGVSCPAGDIVCRGLRFSYEPEREILHGVDLTIPQGKFVSLVGESGCGKSTIGRQLVGLETPTEGKIYYQGSDISALKSREMHQIRTQLQMVFQDPYSSLNPRKHIYEILSQPMLYHHISTKATIEKDLERLLDMVGLPKHVLARYPHEFSGGQRQRIGIAKALSLNPKFIVCDEPVSALDVSIQAQILNLLKSLQKELHLTLLFVGHGLGAVNYVSDRIAVMYLGKIVEIGEAKEIFRHPVHPYTQALIEAVPVPDPEEKDRRKEFLAGEIGDSANPPMGCRFHPRCPHATPECAKQVPELLELAGCPGHLVACPVMAEAKRQRIGEARAAAAGALTDQKGGRSDV